MITNSELSQCISIAFIFFVVHYSSSCKYLRLDLQGFYDDQIPHGIDDYEVEVEAILTRIKHTRKVCPSVITACMPYRTLGVSAVHPTVLHTVFMP